MNNKILFPASRKLHSAQLDRRSFISFLVGSGLAISPFSRIFAKDPGNKHQTAFITDTIYLEHWLNEDHPESPARLQRIMQGMRQSGLIEKVLELSPLPDVESELYRIHTRDHVKKIKSHYGYSHDVAVAVIGGVLAAVEAVGRGQVKNAFCATRPPGHHATNTGKVEGFCFYNAVAVAARYAQEKFNYKKILIVDWDYHHGNGTEVAFYSDPDVLCFSTHDNLAYPGTGDASRRGSGAGEGFNINVPLDCGTNDNDIVHAFETHLMPAAHAFKPELILISAGFDSRKSDLLGCFSITDDGFVRLTEMMKSLADQYCDGRIVSVLEGGYWLPGLTSSVVAHVRSLHST